ncbi:Ppx/GppA phosphatase family protein [Actinokineospora xionganensis]|uniref:Ppx/GppA phosphatase N-terminal domain-containing protein n=1 Tax=Actinokineospora xionganensis TaxID=2684470 RepID=A0ABR7L7P9_9PSEU|nr:hypothetical protein [Actinokineospora xionganensis]MBC6448721.1 hypothetical protein [Actinokineospora xionganensis]
MRIGVIDIGSNSAQLQVVDAFTGSPPLPSYAFKRPTLLGEEFGPDGGITDVGVRRVVGAVAAALAKAQKLEIEELYVFATSAVRDAENRDQVVDAIERRTGLRVQFLSGEDEARLTYHAAHRWYGWSAGRLLLLDIGGGSMEIVLGRDAEPELAVSLPLGAGRLTRRFFTADPPPACEIKDLTRHVQDSVREVADRLRWEGSFRRAIATSKTFKQLARMAGAPPQRAGPFARRLLTVEDLEQWIPRLAELPAAQRAKLRGVSGSRAHQILAGALTAKITMVALGVSTVDLCPWALREGIMLRHLQCVDQAEPLPLQSVRALRDVAPASVIAPRMPMSSLRVAP